ncbi:MAG: hypothetical protein NWF03_01400 [Candidatus Bathyarchaeota archaeon]|nr:hypothetical protein [Candidatus Bathyarchaeota archaeon]
MVNRRWIGAVAGFTQAIIGLLSAFFAVVLFLEVIDLQAVFSLPSELLPICVLVLILFGVFSILNGLFLIREGREL